MHFEATTNLLAPLFSYNTLCLIALLLPSYSLDPSESYFNPSVFTRPRHHLQLESDPQSSDREPRSHQYQHLSPAGASA